MSGIRVPVGLSSRISQRRRDERDRKEHEGEREAGKQTERCAQERQEHMKQGFKIGLRGPKRSCAKLVGHGRDEG
eukprot:3894528-Rhodomonas_salina.5